MTGSTGAAGSAGSAGSPRGLRAGATPEQALAAFRFVERFGSIAAPLAAGALAARWGHAVTVAVLGGVVAAGGVGLAAVAIRQRAARARYGATHAKP